MYPAAPGACHVGPPPEHLCLRAACLPPQDRTLLLSSVSHFWPQQPEVRVWEVPGDQVTPHMTHVGALLSAGLPRPRTQGHPRRSPLVRQLTRTGLCIDNSQPQGTAVTHDKQRQRTCWRSTSSKGQHGVWAEAGGWQALPDTA